LIREQAVFCKAQHCASIFSSNAAFTDPAGGFFIP